MNRKEQKERQQKIVEEYQKGTEIKMIEALFGITKQGIYWVLRKYKVIHRGKDLTGILK